MRGHGSTVVGTSIEQAVYRAIYAEVNAKLQLQAVTAGRSELSQPAGGRHGARRPTIRNWRGSGSYGGARSGPSSSAKPYFARA